MICFCFLLTLGLHFKNNKSWNVCTWRLYTFIKYLAHDFCLKRANKKRGNFHFQKLLIVWMRRLIDQQLWKVDFLWKMLYKSEEKVEFHGHNIPDISLEGSLAIGNHLTLGDQTSKRSLTGTQLNSIYLPVWSCQWVAMTCLQKTEQISTHLPQESASAHRLVCRHSCAGPPVLFKCLVDKVKAMHAMRGLSGNVRMSEWFRLLMLQTDNSWWWWRGI